MFGIGMQELAIILVLALLIFGPKRLPELARTFGKGLAEFRRASNDLRQSFMLEADPPPQPRAAPDPTATAEPLGRPDQVVAPAVPVVPGVDESGHGDLADEEEAVEERPEQAEADRPADAHPTEAGTEPSATGDVTPTKP